MNKRFYFTCLFAEDMGKDTSIRMSIMSNTMQEAERELRKKFKLSDDDKLKFIRFE